MKVLKLFRQDSRKAPASRLHAAIVGQARLPAFYVDGGVPDTIDGRFEMIVLHGYLVLHRLRRAGAAAQALAQTLVDTLFADLDASLREMGAGDLGVGKRVKHMATAFYGRIAAYEEGEKAGKMDEALARNLFGTTRPSAEQLAAMASYVESARRALARQPLPEIAEARLDFPQPFGTGGDHAR